MQPLLVLIGHRYTRLYTPIRVMQQLDRLQDVPPLMNLQRYREFLGIRHLTRSNMNNFGIMQRK